MSTVLIASAEHLSALKERPEFAEAAAFTDAEALRALDAISRTRPSLVVLDRLFAATSRGAALINRIKADPTLAHLEIRVLSPDSEPIRVLPRHSPADAPSGNGNGAAVVAMAGVATTVAAPPLDQRGTRRAPRFKIAGQVDVLVDGNLARLVDLSTVGAQVLSTSCLKPNQRVRIALTDEAGVVRFNASVAWASFEISGNGPRYRAGIEFNDASPDAVDAFCARHRD